MHKILIVEDDKLIREQLTHALTRHGYQMVVADNKEAVFNNLDVDCILLDLSLWDVDGLYIAKAIRAQSSVPIIVVTSRDSQMDELMAIQTGADDFITKPYNIHILIARLEALLKRTKPQKDAPILSLLGFQLDVLNMTLSYEGNRVDLSANEVKILHYLMSKSPEVVSRDVLMNHLWSHQYFVDDNTLTVNINRLRKKITQENIHDPIETIRGAGYRFK